MASLLGLLEGLWRLVLWKWSVESGDRQNEGQLLTAMFLSQWGVMERTVRQSCPRRGGGLRQAAERTHQTSRSLFVLIYKMGL